MAEYKESKGLIAEIGVIISHIKRNPYDSMDETKGTLCGLAHAIECIKSHPTADVVEVVFCKDCKNYEYMSSNNQYFCNKFGGYVTENDYCSRCERRCDNDS